MVKIIPINSSSDPIKGLSSRLSHLWQEQQDRARVRQAMDSLNTRYGLGRKLASEDGMDAILVEMMERIALAFGNLSKLRGKRILDVPCGSKTSRLPTSFSIPILRRGRGTAEEGFTALFEPWFCRILVELGAEPVGVDIGELDGEIFEHYQVDLGRSGALDFLPSASFDALQDSRLFGSPEFTKQFPKARDRLKVAEEVWRQEQRVLKPGGIIIHSDARELMS